MTFWSAVKAAWKYRWQVMVVVLILALGLSNPCQTQKSPIEFGQSSIATQIKYIDKIQTVTEKVPVIKYVPTPVQTKELEQKLGAPLPPDPITTIVNIPVLNEGGKGVGSITPEGKTIFTIYPNKRRWLGLGGKRELIVDYDKNFGKEAGDLGVDLAASFLRTDRIEWYGKVGVGSNTDLGEPELRVGIRAVIDLRRR